MVRGMVAMRGISAIVPNFRGLHSTSRWTRPYSAPVWTVSGAPASPQIVWDHVIA